MPDWQRRTILRDLKSLLGEDGVLTQYQYLHGLQLKNGQLRRFDLRELLHGYFRTVRRRVIWRNLPPAFVFACRGPLHGEPTRSVKSTAQSKGHAKSKQIRRGWAGSKESKFIP